MSHLPLVVLLCVLAGFLVLEAFVCFDATEKKKFAATTSTSEAAHATSETAVKSAVGATYDEMESVAFASKMPLLWMIAFMCLAADAGYNIIVPYLPSLVIHAGATEVGAGFIIACYPFGLVVGALLAPYLLRIVPAVDVIRISGALMGVASACFGLTTHIDHATVAVYIMCLCRVVLGTCIAANETSAQAMVFRMVKASQITRANAVLMSIRFVGQLGSPALGALLYEAGGASAPMLFSSAVFLALYVVFAFWMMPRLKGTALLPKPIPDQPGVFQIWSVPPAWLVIAYVCLLTTSEFAMEPLYNPVLKASPYNLGYTEIGAWTLIAPCSGILAAILLMDAYKKIGIPATLYAAVVVMVVGLIFLGPSKVLSSILPPSLGLLAGAQVLQGAGYMVGLMMTPIMMLDVLWHERKLTKKQVAGSMAATNLVTSGIAGTLAPILSSAVYQATDSDFEWATTSVLILEAVCVPPVIFFLSRRLHPGFAEDEEQSEDGSDQENTNDTVSPERGVAIVNSI
uniref:Major facilitator superfamily (MFS) profile domain-containing protein n=1 Tax=Haptolina brevifila TaxID=156173 RepID=A0A7S2C623_9EUKA